MARFVLDTVDQLQSMMAKGPILANLSIREITFSIPYDPGPDHTPLPLPLHRGGVPVMRLRTARSYLLTRDRAVTLERVRLVKAPLERVAKLELKIRLSQELHKP